MARKLRGEYPGAVYHVVNGTAMAHLPVFILRSYPLSWGTLAAPDERRSRGRGWGFGYFFAPCLHNRSTISVWPMRWSHGRHDAQDRYEREKHGIKTVAAKKDVHLGIEAIQTVLKIQGDGRPRRQIFNTCKHTISEMIASGASTHPGLNQHIPICEFISVAPGRGHRPLSCGPAREPKPWRPGG